MEGRAERVVARGVKGAATMSRTLRAWIIDVDGTLALRAARSPYNMHAVSRDRPNEPVVQLVQALLMHPNVDSIVVISGRDESARTQTQSWLTFHGIEFDSLFLRPLGDNRPDHIVKGEIYDSIIAPRYKVIGVVDDRRSVVEMWRARGLVCLQVADGDF
ncbi:polynucleotide kinase [Microbacterium sp. A84]|uniref:phosphatase domain-containing protein n=1 Tax=Microbacterium sp. A84 TaxID=3450715 RepID=UPI003F43A9C0